MKDLILADNQDITRLGLKVMAISFDTISSVHEARDKSKIISILSNNQDAIVVLDYTLSDFSAAGELLILQQRFPKAHWILFSEELSETFIRSLIFASHSFSILLKSSSLNEIRVALSSVIQGDRFVCNSVADMLMNSDKTIDGLGETEALTSTEKEILKMMSHGKTTKEIAYERNSSFHTIMTHRKNIFRKLKVNNIHEARRYAMRAGLLDSTEYYI